MSERQQRTRFEIIRQRPGSAATTTVVEREGDEQVLTPWPDTPLADGERVRVRISVDHGAGWGPWSDPGTAEAGLIAPESWSAAFISSPGADPITREDPQGRTMRQPPRFARTFTLAGTVASARLYITAQGVVQAEVNGHRVGEEELTPGWTSYRHRLRYATFDITDQLQPGENSLGLLVGDGWWRGHLGFGGGTMDVYGSELAAAAQLEIFYQDGTAQRIKTDDQWRSDYGAIMSSGLYDGEHFDARLDTFDWARLTTRTGTPVRTQPLDATLLTSPTGPPVTTTDELTAVQIEDRGDGRWIVDFGQNHSGRIRLHTLGQRNATITLRHAEVLENDELAVAPLRDAAATDVLITGDEPLQWEPRFTIHGYRFVEVSGWTGTLTDQHIHSAVMHSDLERRGWFECSNPLVNRLHENIVWSTRSNFVDIPTDCPQRDERLGWTGDLQVFAPTASFLFDTTGFLQSWFTDLAAEQAELQWMPPWVPYFPLEPFASLPRDPSAVWGDVAALTPAVVHARTGDLDFLRRQYESATQWIRHVERAAGPDRICRRSEQLGDWLDPAADPENPFVATTDKYLVATAYFAHTAHVLAETASALGLPEDEATWSTLAAEVRDAYAREYVGADGRMRDDTQTAYALTTVFDLWPDQETRAAGAERLADLVRASNGRIATGFAGTPLVSDALTSTGHVDEAYQLLEATECPSWLYTVLAGGTTTWERWDSLRPDGSLNAASMTSFNHYAFGAVGDWLHRTVAGIAPAAPGYRSIRFAPRPGGSITSASATHHTPYGPAHISWVNVDGTLQVDIAVPSGAEGIVDLPGTDPQPIGPGAHHFAQPLLQEA
ncbi:family 78 glycoside hydrolase catalytic domain [Curtobacterium sp. NPDC089689]|uniref:alpha-L-rhamnosidase n=1 Tax=Curtobacterium sp. NPDC089689 TaxID=3363968 RepID=UPI003810D153